MIPHSRPTVSAEDAESVARVVRSGHLAQGAEVEGFERELAARLDVAAVAVVRSGSAALELPLRALDVGPDAEVVVPTYACDALHHAVTRCGATPVLADADPETLGPSPKDVTRRLTRRARAVVIVHPFGLALDLDPFLALGVPVVEDCAQAIGARVAGHPVGSRGALAACSFYATKLLTTGHRGATSRLPTDPPRPRSRRLSRGRSAVDALSLAPVLPVAHRRRGGRGRCSARRGAPRVMAVRAAERRGAGAPPFEASLWMAVRAAERRGAAVRAAAARRGESVTEPPPFEASL